MPRRTSAPGPCSSTSTRPDTAATSTTGGGARCRWRSIWRQAMAESGRGTVVVTGASTGIGRACALRLAAGGFDVLAGVRKEEDGERLREAAGSNGGLTPLRLDVTAPDSVREAGATVEGRTGARGLAGLVNNAGVGTGGPLEFIPLDDIRRQFEVNLIGQIAVTQALLGALRNGRGRI